MYEHRRHPLLTPREFARRQVRHLLAAAVLVLLSLAIGAAGYHYTEGLPWLDSTYNAAMILTGMGPADQLHHSSAKVFATIYALFSGVVFLTAAALIAAPALHRLLHVVHMEDTEEGPGEEQKTKPAPSKRP